MSRYGKLLRHATAVASVAFSTTSATAQEPLPPVPLDPSLLSSQSSVIPAAGLVRGPLGGRAAPCVPLAPCYPYAPGTPYTTPPTTPPATDPPPPQPAPPAPAPDFGDLSRGAGVGQTVGLSAPNLFGDLLGARSSQAFTKQIRPGFLNGKTVVVAVTNVSNLGNGQVRGNLSNATFSVRDATGQNLVSVPSIRVMGIPVSNPSRLSAAGIKGSFTETVPVGTNVRYTPTGSNAADANYSLQYLAGASSVRPAGATFTVPGVIPLGAGRDQLALPVEQALTPQARIEQFALSPVEAVFTGSELQYISQISSTISTPSTLITLPNPGAGGVVGIIKISEDNNPMPRDRVIFNYDYFDNVPFTATGIPVNRYQFGVEKTFFDGWTSLEVRLPFASTINSDGAIASSGTNTEFGNLRLAAKALVLRRETVNVSTGLGVYLPTADSIRVGQPGSPDLIRVQNSSVQLAPFAALLWTPNDRLFAQAWIGGTFDTGGNRVTVDPNMFGGAANIGSLRSANLLTADLQVGYWVYQAEAGYLRGLAPFAELHYNGTVTDGTVLSAGNGVFIGDTGGNSDELNLSAGITARLADHATLSVGAAAPLRTGQNRTFDYQIGVRFNWFFGYTAQNQLRGTSVSSFGQ